MKKAMVFVALLLGTAVFGAIVFGGAAWFARGSSSAGVSQPGAGPVAQPATVAAPSENDGEAQLSGADSLSDFRLADFEFTDHTGQAVDHRIFDGEVTALAFFFTSCPGPCPVMIANMIDVQSRTAGSGLRFAAISVDGSRDTPEVLAAYAQRVGIDIERWRLMTGEPELVSKLGNADATARLAAKRLGPTTLRLDLAPHGPSGLWRRGFWKN